MTPFAVLMAVLKFQSSSIFRDEGLGRKGLIVAPSPLDDLDLLFFDVRSPKLSVMIS